MRLIDADALKNELSDKDYITYTHEYGDAIPVNWIMNAIDNAPTVERLTEFELIKRAILILCRNIRPDGDIGYFDWEDRCKMQDIYHELVKQEVEDAKDE